MIAFTLRCSNGHDFDGWFRGNADFENQQQSGLLTCPVCADAEVSKALMAPNVTTGRSKENAAREVHQAMMAAKVALDQSSAKADKGSLDGASGAVDGEVLGPETASDRLSPTVGEDIPVSALPSLKDAPAPVKAYVEAVRKLRKEVEANTEDVGKGFAEEARKIHHGEKEARPIRGEASLEDAVALDEEGIDLFVLPTLPEDGN